MIKFILNSQYNLHGIKDLILMLEKEKKRQNKYPEVNKKLHLIIFGIINNITQVSMSNVDIDKWYLLFSYQKNS